MGGRLATVEVAPERETPSHQTPQASTHSSASRQKEVSTIFRPAHGPRMRRDLGIFESAEPDGTKIVNDHPLGQHHPQTHTISVT